MSGAAGKERFYSTWLVKELFILMQYGLNMHIGPSSVKYELCQKPEQYQVNSDFERFANIRG